MIDKYDGIEEQSVYEADGQCFRVRRPNEEELEGHPEWKGRFLVIEEGAIRKYDIILDIVDDIEAGLSVIDMAVAEDKMVDLIRDRLQNLQTECHDFEHWDDDEIAKRIIEEAKCLI